MLTNLSDISISISNDEKVIELVTEVLSKVKNIEDKMAATKKGHTERKSSHEAKNTDDEHEHIEEIRSSQKLLELGFIWTRFFLSGQNWGFSVSFVILHGVDS